MLSQKNIVLFAAATAVVLLAGILLVALLPWLRAAAGGGWALYVGGILLSLVFAVAGGLVVVMAARRVLAPGLHDAWRQLEQARVAAHVSLVTATPAIKRTTAGVDREQRQLAELRALLDQLSRQVPATPATQDLRLDLLRSIAIARSLSRETTGNRATLTTLQQWADESESRQSRLRDCSEALWRAFEELPDRDTALTGAAPGSEAGAGFGFAQPRFQELTEESLDLLPPALAARLRNYPLRGRTGDSALDGN